MRAALFVPLLAAGCVVNAPAAVSCDDDADCADGTVCVAAACVVVVVVVEGEGEGEGEGDVVGEGEGEGDEGEGEGEGEEGEGEGEGVVGTTLTQLLAAPAARMTDQAQTTTLTLTQVTAAPTQLTSASFALVVDGVDLSD